MHGWMDGWMNGWMDGWMDGWINKEFQETLVNNSVSLLEKKKKMKNLIIQS